MAEPSLRTLLNKRIQIHRVYTQGTLSMCFYPRDDQGMEVPGIAENVRARLSYIEVDKWQTPQACRFGCPSFD